METLETASPGIAFNDQALFEKCRKIELLNQKLYFRFAGFCHDVPESERLNAETTMTSMLSNVNDA